MVGICKNGGRMWKFYEKLKDSSDWIKIFKFE
jgi:hypothetical protein